MKERVLFLIPGRKRKDSIVAFCNTIPRVGDFICFDDMNIPHSLKVAKVTRRFVKDPPLYIHETEITVECAFHFDE